MTCETKESLVENRIDRVLTQYRESPKFLHMLRTYLGFIAEAKLRTCDLPSYFDIDTAVGDQLTILGKRLGWPRCHCVCDTQPVFGFDCNTIQEKEVSGFCDESVVWEDCENSGVGDICISDDEVYRKFLKVRRYQFTKKFDITSLEECLKIFWGDQAVIVDEGFGRVIIAPGRELSDQEIALLQLYPRVLPVALGVNVLFHFSGVKVFGFGEGWGEFCEEWRPDGLPITDGEDDLETENSELIITGPLTQDANWMCGIDVKPYGCI